MKNLPLSSPSIAIDLGTNNTRIYVKDKGIVINEPSIVIAKSNDSKEIIAIGESAENLIGRLPSDVKVVHPIRDGVIVDYEMAQVMINYFMTKAIGRTFIRHPKVVVTMPGSVSRVERSTVVNTLANIGIRQLFVVERAFAAALGAGLPVYEPQGSFIVDIGAGTTEVAIVSMGGIILSNSLRLAGNRIDEAIEGYLKKQHNILITERVAEQIKMDLADIKITTNQEHSAVVRGRDIVAAMPLAVTINMSKLREVIQEPLHEILLAIKWVLSRTPPETASDILENGITLTGGSSYLPNLDQMIEDEFGVPVRVAKDPAECAIMGAGYMADHFELLESRKERI